MKLVFPRSVPGIAADRQVELRLKNGVVGDFATFRLGKVLHHTEGRTRFARVLVGCDSARLESSVLRVFGSAAFSELHPISHMVDQPKSVASVPLLCCFSYTNFTMASAAICVRPARPEDAPLLADFNCRLASETEGKKLDRDTVGRGVRRGLDHGGEVTYFVAELDQVVIGMLMITREWSDWRDGWLYWLQSVYVDQAHRGRGVFQDLLQAVTDTLAATPDVSGLRLYVESQNGRAQSVYRRCGFHDADYKVFEKMFDSASSQES